MFDDYMDAHTEYFRQRRKFFYDTHIQLRLYETKDFPLDNVSMSFDIDELNIVLESKRDLKTLHLDKDYTIKYEEINSRMDGMNIQLDPIVLTGNVMEDQGTIDWCDC